MKSWGKPSVLGAALIVVLVALVVGAVVFTES
jgi:hypothetical protein